MADFCKQCALEMWGPSIDNDFKGDTPAEAWEAGFANHALCEGCGPISVDPEGNCVSSDCMKAGEEGHGLPWKVEHKAGCRVAWKTGEGVVSECTCGAMSGVQCADHGKEHP